MEKPANPGEPPQEESIFREEEFSMEGYDKHIRIARIILFIIAALQLIGVFTSMTLIVYISLLVLDAIFDPSTIYKGIVLKIIIIVMLISGLRNGKDAQDMKEAFGKNRD